MSPRQWHLINAQEKPLGRLATQIATLLMGKHKPHFSRHLDLGDYVVVINATQTKLTGKKARQKIYDRYSGYPSGRKTITFQEMLAKKPAFPIYHAVSGMLPKNKLRKNMLNRLKIHPDTQHPYTDKFPTSDAKAQTKPKL